MKKDKIIIIIITVVVLIISFILHIITPKYYSRQEILEYVDSRYIGGYGNKTKDTKEYDNGSAYLFTSNDFKFYVYTEAKHGESIFGTHVKYMYSNYCSASIDYYETYIKEIANEKRVNIKIEPRYDLNNQRYPLGYEPKIIVLTVNSREDIYRIANFMPELNYELNLNFKEDYDTSKFNLKGFKENDIVFVETKDKNGNIQYVELPIARNMEERKLQDENYYKSILLNEIKEEN